MSGIPGGEELYLRYKDKVLGYIRSHVGDPYDAEDLCSAVFVKVYSRLGSYTESLASVSTWIYSITRNTVIDYYRTRRVHAPIDEDLPVEDSTDEALLREESLRSLADALKALPRELSDLIILRYYKNLTLTEIAEKMHLSYGVTKNRHREALLRLRTALGGS